MRNASVAAEASPSRDVLRHVLQFCRLSSKEFSALLKETVKEWSNDKAPRLGASLAFYTLLSLAPLLIVIVTVAALAFGKEAAEGQLYWQVRGLLGPEEAKVVQGVVQSAYKPGTGLIATLLGLATLALGATSVVVELSDALNTIWRVPTPEGETGMVAGIRRIVKERFYSFTLVLGVGFLLLVSLVLNAWLSAMGTFFGSFLPAPESILQAATFLISFLVVTALFAAIYKLLPSVRLEWSDVIIGASVTSLLFTIGKQLVGLYLGKAGFGSTYGAAGSLVILLVWVYYSAQLFFLGAEFTKVYTRSCGSSLRMKLEGGVS
jgi:membrane protein